LLDGQTEVAREHADLALRAHPEQPPALHVLALAEAKANHYPRAAALLVSALELGPEQWVWRIDLGTIYLAARSWGLAAEQFSLALEHDRDHVRALHGYGTALLELGETEKARSCFARLATLQPEAQGPILGLARCYMRKEQFNEAVEILRRALMTHPDGVEYMSLLASTYSACGDNELAREAWERVVTLSPGGIEALGALVLTCWKLGDLEATMKYCRTIIQAGRATAELYSFFVYMLLFDPRETAESIKKACQEFRRFICPPPPAHFRRRPWDAERKQLRIGYLSGEFTGGAAFYFLSPLLGNHERDTVEVFCYHTRQAFDDQTRWYQGVSRWRDCRGWDDKRLRNQIRADGIDILVDLSGFFPDHRLRIFAGRVAPVQAAFPNCPVTTGIASIDYIFTDRWTCPKGSEMQYTERAVRLPSGYLAYAPPPDAPPLSPLPAAQNGNLTFGLFQRRPKMNGGVWDAVAETLHGMPDSRLLIQHGDPTLEDRDSRARRELVHQFSERGIDEGRLDFIGACNHLDTMASMARADIALDTFPYQGQTTTCECLWMGVPVVALSGRAHVARVGSAILQRVGLGELTAETPQDYVRIALNLARDRERLAAMRGTLRDQVRASSLLDGKRLARTVEAAYCWMWRNWCIGAESPFSMSETTGG